MVQRPAKPPVDIALTVGELAERLAGSDEVSAGYRARQIRGWAQAGLYEDDVTARGAGRTSAQIFNRYAIVRSRIFCVLSAIGMTSRELSRVIRVFRNMSDPPVGIRFIPGLRYATDEYLRGRDDWDFGVALDGKGEVVGGGFQRHDAQTPPLGEVIITIKSSELFRDLADERATAGEQFSEDKS